MTAVHAARITIQYLRTTFVKAWIRAVILSKRFARNNQLNPVVHPHKPFPDYMFALEPVNSGNILTQPAVTRM